MPRWWVASPEGPSQSSPPARPCWSSPGGSGRGCLADRRSLRAAAGLGGGHLAWRRSPGAGLRTAALPLAARLALELGVDLAAEHDRDAGQVEPEHQDDETSERAVGLAVRAELGHVEGEPQRGRQED